MCVTSIAEPLSHTVFVRDEEKLISFVVNPAAVAVIFVVLLKKEKLLNKTYQTLYKL